MWCKMTLLVWAAAMTVTRRVVVSGFHLTVRSTKPASPFAVGNTPRYLWSNAIRTALAAATTTKRASTSTSTLSGVRLSMSSTKDNESSEMEPVKRKVIQRRKVLKRKRDKVPITLLGGFLGAGKTCTLQHLLENSEGVKIGLIVNDVASVNIDAKLVSSKSKSQSLEDGGVVQLENGCVCCSLAEELLTSVDKLMASAPTSTDTGVPFDAIVIELSGVADPLAIKQNWDLAKAQKHPSTKLVDMSRVVTVIDASTFGTDWMTWDVAAERDGWVAPEDECAGERKVPELLADQIETADILLINKIDLAGPEQVEIATTLARSLNDKAIIEQVEFGRVSPKQILQSPSLVTKGKGKTDEEKAEVDSSSHSHSHDHACEDKTCTDPSHSHSHDHAETSACTDPACTNTSPNHSHTHDHAESACNNPDCKDPDCNDSSQSRSQATSTDNLGISSFVYRASRPFDMGKLMALLSQWPVPIKEELDIELLQRAQNEGYEVQGKKVHTSTNPFVGVLRSKGFCWFAPSAWSGRDENVWRHDTAMYWSHAGKHFGISTAGKWWGSISDRQMREYFADNMKEYKRIKAEDFVTEEFQDRRQEIVFIGTRLDQEAITNALNNCLISETTGMERYRENYKKYIETLYAAPTFSTRGIPRMEGF